MSFRTLSGLGKVSVEQRAGHNPAMWLLQRLFVPLRRLPSGALRLDEGIIGNAVQSRDVPNAVRLTGPQDATDRQVREGVGPDDAKSEDRPDETGAGEGRR